METFDNRELQYERAKNKVKEIKGFYIHALVYVLVNSFSLFWKYQKSGDFEINNWGSGLWGIGLLAHGLSVFIPNFIFGSKWEERKIREIMEKDRMR